MHCRVVDASVGRAVTSVTLIVLPGSQVPETVISGPEVVTGLTGEAITTAPGAVVSLLHSREASPEAGGVPSSSWVTVKVCAPSVKGPKPVKL